MSIQDYETIEAAIGYLEENFLNQPTLAEVADSVNMSEYHLQRLFRQWAGISPKRFLQVLTASYAREKLSETRSVMEAAHASGLSGSGRLHDLMINLYAATPAETRSGGAGLQIHYGFHHSPFGEYLLGLTDKGICWLAFVPPEGQAAALAALSAAWQAAELQHAPQRTAVTAAQLFARQTPLSLTLHVSGTNFQVRVWEALLQIPCGGILSYEDLAAAIGNPKAARAVGGALARNTIAYLIPCHRVIRSSGLIGNYRWGSPRKKALIVWEAAQALGDSS